MPTKSKFLLVILDGWGLSALETGNAPLQAKTPVLDFCYANYPKTLLSASGLEVGLSQGEPGNSEVGHMNIGSGRVVWENLPRIDQAIESGEFQTNDNVTKALDHAKKNNSALHLIGLVSDGGVHSHIRHLFALLGMASKAKIAKVYVHFISDGRDTAPEVAESYAEQLESAYKKFGLGSTATLIGRYFAMDRDTNWDREEKALKLYLDNTGDHYITTTDAISSNYKNGKSDEFIEPAVIGEGGKIGENDSIILFNHRSDRMRQLLSLLSGAKSRAPHNVLVTTMTQYDKAQSAPIVFPPLVINNTLSEIISAKGLRQFHTAETEKYAHVTYFFKAGKEKILPGEEDVVVPSRKSPTYDKIPEMSAPGIVLQVKKALASDYDFIVVNFANGDMVGHTGIFEAAVKACEAVDQSLAEIFMTASEHGYKVVLTADHGNCEQMIDEATHQQHKEHTTNPVPFVYLDFAEKPFDFKESSWSKDDYIAYAAGTPIGVLADIAPSILANMGLPKDAEMGGMDLTSAIL